MAVFSDRLKEIRRTNHWTQETLAYKLNVSVTAVFLWESGRRNPTLAMIERIAETLNVSPAYLMGWDSSNPSINVPEKQSSSLDSSLYKARADQLNILFSHLNEAGQQKALEHLILLTKVQDYQRFSL